MSLFILQTVQKFGEAIGDVLSCHQNDNACEKKNTFFLKNLEALAYQRAVQFAKEIGLTQFIFEGDSSIVIQAILKGSSVVLPYNHVIEDIRVQALDFQLFVFTHAPRKCNVVVDALAKKSKTCRGHSGLVRRITRGNSLFSLF